jgi:hypothetical protein
VVEGQEILVDWGVKSVREDKNARCIKEVEKLIIHYQPNVLALRDYRGETVKRSARVKELGEKLISFAENRGIKVALLSREKMYRALINGKGTKHALAEILAKRFPDELGFRLPPKRRPWMSEDYRMSIFDAVALALTYLYKRSR